MPVYNESMSGGVLGNGAATTQNNVSVIDEVTVLAGGTALLTASYDFDASGGTQLGGSVSGGRVYNEVASGGAVLGGSASTSKDLDFIASGGVNVDGVAVVQQRSRYFPDGGENTTSGSADARYVVFFDQSVYWDLNQYVFVDKTFAWVSGEQPLRWYRVQGCCAFPTAAGSGLPGGDQFPGGCDVIGIQTDDTKCVGATGQQQYVQNILARTVSDVCIELTRQKSKWQVCSIKRWSRPADPTLSDPATDECNELTEVPYNDIPECLPFTLQSDTITFIAATTIISEAFVRYDCACTPPDFESVDPSLCGEIEVYGDGRYYIKSGAPTPTTVIYKYFANGGMILTGGSAESDPSWNSDLVTDIKFTSFIDNEELVFTAVDEGAPIVQPTGTIATACGTCTSMPNQFYMQHNIVNPSVFYNFLQRNSLTMPNVLPMTYNRKVQMWTSNQHFVGVSDDNANNESWRFSFEFGCPNQIGGESLGKGAIKLSLTVVRKNLTTGIDFDTRLLILFPADDFCASIRNFSDDFVFRLDTKTNYVLSDGLVVPQSVLLYDKIGMFKSSYWAQNPALTIRMSRTSEGVKVDRKDISGIFPTAETLLARGLEITRSPIGV